MSDDPEITEFEGRQGNAAHRVVIGRVHDDGDQQLVDYDGLADETHTKVLRVMPHGLASNPPADSEGIVLGLGTRDMPVVIGGESPVHRPRDLPAGATMLYDSDEGRVYLDAGGNLHAKVKKKAFVEAGEEIHLKAPKIVIEGAVHVIGDITHTGDMTTSGEHTDIRGRHV